MLCGGRVYLYEDGARRSSHRQKSLCSCQGLLVPDVFGEIGQVVVAVSTGRKS